MPSVLNAHYVDIVDKFEKKIYEKLDPETQGEIGQNHKRVWELAGRHLDTSPIFQEYFPQVGASQHVASDHLTRKIKQYKTAKTIPFKDLYLVKILIFLEHDFPRNLPKEYLNTEEKQANELYEVYKNKLQEDIKKKLNAFPKVEINKDDKILECNVKPFFEIAERSVEQFINTYFQFLSRSNYVEALNSWSESQKKDKWKSQIALFYLDYGELLSVNDIVVFDVTFVVKDSEKIICYCKLLYDETSFLLGNESFWTFFGGSYEWGHWFSEKWTRQANELTLSARTTENVLLRRKVFSEIMELENKLFVIGELYEQHPEILDLKATKRLEQVELKFEFGEWKIQRWAPIDIQARRG